MLRAKRFPLGWIILFVVLLARSAAAQANTGTVSGTVVDGQGQPVPGATLTLTNEATTVARVANSDSAGGFKFLAVPPGSYKVRVGLTGFQTLERTHNVLNASGAIDLGPLKLAVGTMNEVVTVEVKGTQVDVANSDHASLLTSTQLAQIQTKGRDVMNLLRLLPGTHYDTDVDALQDSFGTQVPQINGLRRNWNQVTIDGLNGNELSGTSRFNSSIGMDAIAEVKVLTSGYRAEFGRTGGANIQIVTKSGSSDYQANLFYYGRRDKFNANTWENNRRGLPRAEYVQDTYGLNVGGPVKIPGLYNQGDNKKLFFFYSLENPNVQAPAQLRRYRMPTALERAGNFSQTLDSNGRLVVVRDPLTGQPFPGNIIPASRFDPNGRALLNMLPLPNALDQPDSARYNFERQETPDKPRWSHLLRLDWKPSASDSVFIMGRTFDYTQTGSEITAGPAKWGFFNANYISGDNSVTLGYTKIFRSNLVNEATFGIRRATEAFPAATDADYQKILRKNIGLTLGQFNPGLNPDGVMPIVTFNLANTASNIDSPDFTFDSRIGAFAYDVLASFQDHLTWIKGRHTLKVGGYFEYMKNNEARGSDWMGRLDFRQNSANPIDTNFAFSNALLGVFNQYNEVNNFGSTKNRAQEAEWYLQDTWKATSRLTIDAGLRFLWYQPYYRSDDQTSNFVPSLYDPKKAPRLYQPAIVNGRRVALDPVSGQVLNAIYIGAYVPGTGDIANGMLLANDPSAPKGFRESQGMQPEPRLGLVWDVQGNGKTAVKLSGGLFHQARLGGGSLGNLRNPPYNLNPAVNFGVLSQLFDPNNALLNRPGNVESLETNAQTPSLYSWTVGVQQDVGWGTVIDVSYVGSVGRHMEMYYDINPVPDGARFLDQHPENRDPTIANAALPPEFLRPYRGYQNIRTRGDWGTSNYNALQVQLIRRYIHGLQFSAAYTYQRSLGIADEDPGNLVAAVNRDPATWLYAPLAQSNNQTFIVNYTWDVPKASSLVNNGLVKLLFDGWQISGENAFVSGDWAPVTLTTTDNFDFTGGEMGQGQCAAGSDPCLVYVRPNLVGDPGSSERNASGGFLNTAAFARPTKGSTGNAPRNVVQKAGINNWNLAAFKNFGLGGASGHRKLQVRIEAYNVLNHTQFDNIDRTARFDAQGNQVNAAFGMPTTSRQPRIIQGSLRLSF
jgi:hypothetical protein